MHNWLLWADLWADHKPNAYISSDVWRAIANKFQGSELAGDFSTYDGKALAAKMIQERSYVIESLGGCIHPYPIMSLKNSSDHIGDSALESKLFSAVTGRDVTEDEMMKLGERVLNLEREIRIREGHRGRSDDVLPEYYHTMPLASNVLNPDCLVPGQNGEVICRKGEVVDKAEFERIKDEYYQLRGWDVGTGLQTISKLNELGLEDVGRDLDRIIRS